MAQSDVRSRFYEFDEFRVDTEKRLLYRSDDLVQLTPKVFETLVILIEHRHEVLDKEQLMNLLWSDSFVEESNLVQNIAVLRRALGENSKEHKFVLTVPGRGYRFVAEVIVSNENSSTPSQQGDQRAAVAGNSGISWLTVGLITTSTLIAVALGVWLFRAPTEDAGISAQVKSAQMTSWSGLDAYPSISADGNSIAYSSDKNGNFEIYVKQLVSGARELQLTSDGGQNFQPAFSPDGALIAYHSRKPGGVWIMPANGGAARQLSERGSNPAFSPDGRTVVFQSDPLNDLGAGVRNGMPPSTIWTIPVAGGDPRQVTRPGAPLGGHGAPNYSPDGKRIVFDVNDFARSEVWTVSSDGSDAKQLCANGSDAVYAADGRSVFVASNRGSSLLRVKVAANGNPIGEPVRVTDGTARIRHLSASLKANRLVYTALSTESNIWFTMLSPDSTGPVGDPIQVTHNSNIRTMQPAFSPDGRKIAFQSFDSSGVVPQIWTMDADGKNQTQLATGGGITPWWFPDSERIGYLSNRDGVHAYYSVVVATGKETKHFEITRSITAVRPSPDGRTVAFTSNEQGGANVWLIPIDGGDARQLTFDRESAMFPAWSPDGKLIAVQLKRGVDNTVGVVPFEGGDVVELNFGKGGNWIYDWSPDGDKVLFAGLRDGIWNVYWFSRVANQTKPLTSFTKLNSYVRYPAISPLREKIAYEYAETTGNIWKIDFE